jgi:hypothetical protein
MNYLDLITKKYTHMASNNRGNITRNIVKNTLNIANRILPIIPNITGLTNPIIQVVKTTSNNILKRMMN